MPDQVHSIKVVDFDCPSIELESVDCAAGDLIRHLSEIIGESPESCLSIVIRKRVRKPAIVQAEVAHAG